MHDRYSTNARATLLSCCQDQAVFHYCHTQPRHEPSLTRAQPQPHLCLPMPGSLTCQQARSPVSTAAMLQSPREPQSHQRPRPAQTAAAPATIQGQSHNTSTAADVRCVCTPTRLQWPGLSCCVQAAATCPGWCQTTGSSCRTTHRIGMVSRAYQQAKLSRSEQTDLPASGGVPCMLQRVAPVLPPGPAPSCAQQTPWPAASGWGCLPARSADMSLTTKAVYACQQQLLCELTVKHTAANLQ